MNLDMVLAFFDQLRWIVIWEIAIGICLAFFIFLFFYALMSIFNR